MLKKWKDKSVFIKRGCNLYNRLLLNQETRLQNLSKQFESALKQVQDLAVKAIEGTSNVNYSYQAIKEIALEQAKSQLKNE